MPMFMSPTFVRGFLRHKNCCLITGARAWAVCGRGVLPAWIQMGTHDMIHRVCPQTELLPLMSSGKERVADVALGGNVSLTQAIKAALVVVTDREGMA